MIAYEKGLQNKDHYQRKFTEDEIMKSKQMLKPLLQKKGTSRQDNTTTENIEQVTLEKVKRIVNQLN